MAYGPPTRVVARTPHNVTLAVDVSAFTAATMRAVRASEQFGVAFRASAATGQRRHGLIKHLRDLRRAERKRIARTV